MGACRDLQLTLVGVNRRYPAKVNRELEELLSRPQPISLSEVELDGADQTAITPARPIPVLAFIRFPEQAVPIDAIVIRYTPRCLLIEYETRAGAVHQVWIWSSAARTKPAGQ